MLNSFSCQEYVNKVRGPIEKPDQHISEANIVLVRVAKTNQSSINKQ